MDEERKFCEICCFILKYFRKIVNATTAVGSGGPRRGARARERGEGGEQRDCGEGVRRWGAVVGRQREQAKRAGCEAAHRAGGVAKGSC